MKFESLNKTPLATFLSQCPGQWALPRGALLAMALLLCCGLAYPQSQTSGANTAAPVGPPNITGFWALRFDSANVPKASLLPSVTLKVIEAHERQDLHTIRWCQYVGMPFLMQSPAPLDVLVGTTQIAIISETPSAVRHIYTDRTTRPDPTTFDPTTNGYSIGHWEGDALIVDTIGFSDTRYTSIPGGGFRTPTSHLKERYQLVNGGKELEVTSTWEDPKVFAKPHTYSFRYYRVPREFNSGEFFCDSNDQDRARFLTEPPNPVK